MLVISSKRYENDVIAYGPFNTLDEAQIFMLELAKRADTCSLTELEDNYNLDTDQFTFHIVTNVTDPSNL